MTAVTHLTVADADAGMRLDRWFRQRFPHVTHGHLSKLLRTGQIRLDGGRCSAGARLQAGQAVRLPPLPEAPVATGPARRLPDARELDDIAARVIHMDDWVMAIDKPAGLAVQGGSGLSRHLDALLDGLRFGAAERPRLVHRLDRQTSGILLLARHAPAARALQACFREGRVEKTYWALVAGVPDLPRDGRLAIPLAKRGKPGRERVEVAGENGRRAVTFARIVATAGRVAAWLELRPLTGRTHQLRVHCAAIGHPILGDGKYGSRTPGRITNVRRLHLHAQSLRLPHPEGGMLNLACALPRDLQETWDTLGLSLDGDGP